MSDDTTTQAPDPQIPAATPDRREPTSPSEPAPSANAGSPDAPLAAAGGTDAGATDTGAASANGGASDGTGGAPRRRRRGSRGGRNRRKPAGTATGSPSGTTTGARAGGAAGPEREEPDTDEPGDWRDAEADRGLTSDDVAAVAREDAEIADEAVAASATGAGSTALPRIGDARPAPKPQIGDRRPAPDAGDAPKADGAKTGSRRRRRGGRGRGRGGSGSSGTNGNGGRSAAPTTDDVVHADLGVGDAGALDELDETTRARRRGRTRKGRPAGRYMMSVHVRPDGHTHIALLEGRVLVEHSVSTARDDDTSIDGNIYLGRVQNVLPGMEAAFVDIGTPKNGVLYRGDVTWDRGEIEGQQPKIERLLKNGQNVLVQVTKNPIGAKGARLTQEVSLAGRFVVMVPGQPSTYGISKRLPDDERKRLRRILEGLRPPDAGLIVRTAAEGATADELERDMRRLRQQWEQISALADRSKQARLLYQEPPLVLRLLREEFTKEYRGVLIDDRALYEEVKAYIEAVTPELAERIEYYDEEAEGLPLFERHHVQEQLLKALDRKVWLPSGGSLIIERTEALTVIDVNTGKNVGKSNLEETVFRNNLEAADEVARQLRLRDIGGIIVIDFIDMEIRENREKVVKGFRDALARDKTRTQVFDISDLGLVEMTRKRVSEGLVESVSEICSTCEGRGYLLDETLLEELR
jgi:ribonuclease E